MYTVLVRYRATKPSQHWSSEDEYIEMGKVVNVKNLIELNSEFGDRIMGVQILEIKND